MMQNRMSLFTRNVVTACCSVALLSAAPAMFAQDMGSGSGKMAMASPSDKKFVKEALGGGMAEVELGKLAAEKGSSDDVKQFGQKMVDDHTKLGDQMKEVAGKVGVTPPTMIPAKDKMLKTKLEAMSGDAFDKAYIKAMVKDHQEDEMAFKKEADSGTSPDVKSAASDGEKVVSMHLDMIKDIAKKHNVMTGSSSMGQ